MNRILVIVLIICSVSACSNTKKASKVEFLSSLSALSSLNPISCSIYVHPTKSHSIGDYQACRINNANSTSSCMNKLGWERKTGKEICSERKNKKYFSGNIVSTCLKKSTINSKVDHELVNECLSKHEPTNTSLKVESVEIKHADL